MSTARLPCRTEMLQIPCPWCGPREEIEFRHGGQGVSIPRESSDAEWAHVLFHRANPAGPLAERWVHVHGCGQWFRILRDTVTHEITESQPLYPSVGESP
jgi:heterotetrameric sarcosine oxidase delta subunit